MEMEIPKWLRVIIVAFTAILAVIIVIASYYIWEQSRMIAYPPLPQGDATKDAAETYAALVAAEQQRVNGMYEVVVIKGILPMFTALVTGIVAYIVGLKAVGAFAKALVGQTK
jgi:hypothetical protein